MVKKRPNGEDKGLTPTQLARIARDNNMFALQGRGIELYIREKGNEMTKLLDIIVLLLIILAGIIWIFALTNCNDYSIDNRITNQLVDEGKLPESRREIYRQ